MLSRRTSACRSISTLIIFSPNQFSVSLLNLPVIYLWQHQCVAFALFCKLFCLQLTALWLLCRSSRRYMEEVQVALLHHVFLMSETTGKLVTFVTENGRLGASAFAKKVFLVTSLKQWLRLRAPSFCMKILITKNHSMLHMQKFDFLSNPVAARNSSSKLRTASSLLARWRVTKNYILYICC